MIHPFLINPFFFSFHKDYSLIVLTDLTVIFIVVDVTGGFTLNIRTVLVYSQFHKTLPRSSVQMYWISVRFYETGCILKPYRDPVYKCTGFR